MSEDGPVASAADQDLIERLREMATQLQAEQGETVPAAGAGLTSGSAVKGAVKRGCSGSRAATRRSDRLATELASVARACGACARHGGGPRAGAWDIDRLDHAVQERPVAIGRTADGPGAPQVDDAYYWAFEGRMRGDANSVAERLRQYERFAVPLRDRLANADAAAAEAPLWLDLGCGFGEFCELLREWGWRVQGVDTSPGRHRCLSRQGHRRDPRRG